MRGKRKEERGKRKEERGKRKEERILSTELNTGTKYRVNFFFSSKNTIENALKAILRETNRQEIKKRLIAAFLF
ncbi:hypothetical protein [uncultured Microbulbifer sp.]|uniref:hypothetical protein n=1 Tax=uncultured Microbulbifer sp. TaxID=348147 RepID=UPI0026293F91|nr:hypothetical protein [uncultured Microbulbifer sp.]